MSQEPDNFDNLRKLLAVKKYEQPPPGYFDQFSSEVMARLRAGEHRERDLWKDLGEEASWLQRLLGLFNAQPAMAGAFGMMVCGAMLTGLYLTQSPANEPVKASVPVVESVSPPLALSQHEPTIADVTSTNPVVNSLGGTTPGTTLFDRIGIGGQTAPVSFSPAGN